MADLEQDGWELESAVEKQLDNPGFRIPSSEERSHLQIGDRVKLLFVLLGAMRMGSTFKVSGCG